MCHNLFSAYTRLVTGTTYVSLLSIFNMMEKSLIKIERSDWNILKECYAQRKSLSCSFNLLETIHEWIKADPDLPIEIYSSDKNWRIHGTFLLQVNLYNYTFILLFKLIDILIHYILSVLQLQTQIYCNTLREKEDTLCYALNCLPKSKELIICGFPEAILPTIRLSFMNAGLKTDDFLPDCTVWHHLPIQKALEFEIKFGSVSIIVAEFFLPNIIYFRVPNGFVLKRLDVKYVDQVNRIWPHRAPGSEEYIRFLIERSPSTGVFIESTGDLVAWCLT